MKKIVFATGNKGKLAEIREIMQDYEIVSMAEAGFGGDIDENGASFEENALIKARCVFASLKDKFSEVPIVMADDSGLEIDALGGEPGIYSARYLGEDTSFDEKMDDVLRRMENVEDEKRSARFVCAVAAVFPDGSEKVVRGTMEGVIARKKTGDRGFGYDPIFFLPSYGLTVAEMSSDQKNKESHRGAALRLMKKELK